MHSSRAACVFGEARLISSSRRRFAKTGPGRNSNSFERWLKTFTPVTSDGSRSGVNWRRENELRCERLGERRLPHPGESSMIRWPSLRRHRTQSCSVPLGACTTWRRLSVMRSIASAGRRPRRASVPWRLLHVYALLQQPFGPVRDSGCDPLGRLVDPLFSPLRDDDDLVVRSASNPTSLLDTSLKTKRFARLATIFSRARSRPRSPRSAAKPTRTCRSRRSPSAARTSPSAPGRRSKAGVLQALVRDGSAGR